MEEKKGHCLGRRHLSVRAQRKHMRAQRTDVRERKKDKSYPIPLLVHVMVLRAQTAQNKMLF